MNRDALVERNRLLAEAYHAQPMRHRLRSRLLRLASQFPFAPQPASEKRILILRPDHIGDLLLTTPAIDTLKRAMPQADIHVLAGPWAAPILATSRTISQVLTLRYPGFDRTQGRQRPLAPYRLLLHTSRQLRTVGYGTAIIMRPDHWWGALLAHAAGIRERVGYAIADVQPFLTHAIPFQRTHAVRQSLRLVERWTGALDDVDVPYHLPLDDSDIAYVDGLLGSLLSDPDQPIVCVHAGAGTWAKQWEPGRWAQIADALAAHAGMAVMFTGASGEVALVDSILSQAQRRHRNLAGTLSLGQLGVLYERARLVIGCDSGPLHIAAAVHSPTLALFGPANPAEFAPWGDRQRHQVLTSTIGCRPCRVLDWGDDAPAHHPCLRDITVHDVLAAASRMLHANLE